MRVIVTTEIRYNRKMDDDVACAMQRKEPLGGMVFQQAIDNVKAATAKAEA